MSLSRSRGTPFVLLSGTVFSADGRLVDILGNNEVAEPRRSSCAPPELPAVAGGSTAESASEASPARHVLVPTELCAVFGAHLKAARLKRGLHRSDLADRKGLTASRLSLIESGQLSITFTAFAELATRVGVDPITVLGLSNATPVE